jgi:hypothetical protein
MTTKKTMTAKRMVRLGRAPSRTSCQDTDRQRKRKMDPKEKQNLSDNIKFNLTKAMAKLEATIRAVNEGKFYQIGMNLNVISNLYFNNVRSSVDELKAHGITGKELKGDKT